MSGIKMLQVEMPDGTVIDDVPEGTTQEELSKRYSLYQQDQKKNIVQKGLDFVVGGAEKLINKLPEPLAAYQRIALGATENAAQLASGGYSMLAGGASAALIGGPTALITGKPDAIPGIYKSVSDTGTYEPRSTAGKQGSENIQHQFEYGKRGAGELGKALEGGPLGESVGEFMFDYVTTILPLKFGLRSMVKERHVKEREQRIKDAQDFDAKRKLENELEAQKQEQVHYEIDNNMVRYPQNYQAPQLGLGGKVSLPEGATRPKVKPEDRVTQESYDADLQRTAAEETARQEGPLPFEPPIQTQQLGIEKQSAQGPMQFTPKDVRVADMPLESMLVQDHQPTSPLMSHREGSPVQTTQRLSRDPLDMPIDPVSRVTAIEHLEKLTPDVMKLSELERKHNEIMKSGLIGPHEGREVQLLLEGKKPAAWLRGGKSNELHQALVEGTIVEPFPDIFTLKGKEKNAVPIKKYADAFENRILSLFEKKEMGRHLGYTAKEMKAYDYNYRIVDQIRETQERIMKGMRDAAEATQKNPPPIEKTVDGRQMLKLPKRMSGKIDTDLLTLGVSHLVEKLGALRTVMKFEGTFHPKAIAELINRHFRNERELWFGTGSTVKVGFLSPDEFHKLAAERIGFNKDAPPKDRIMAEDWAEELRKPLRPLIKNPGTKGWSDIPLLQFKFQRYLPDGSVLVKVIGHEGRHRNDVLRELGVDKGLVQFIYQNDKNGHNTLSIINKARDEGKRVIVESEGSLHDPNGSSIYQVDMPDHAKLDSQDLPKQAPGEPLDVRVRKSQAGAADVELLTNIATLGVASLLKKGLNAAKAEPKTKAPTPKNTKPDEQSVLLAAAGETRTVKELKETLTKEQMQTDIPNSLSASGMANMTNASFLAHYTDNPMVRYVLDRAGNIIRMNNLMGNLSKEGSTFGLKGLTSHQTNPRSPKGVWDALSRKEKEQLATVANEYGGIVELSRSQLKSLGLSEKVVDAYKTFVKGYEKPLDDVNSVRTDNPINKLPGYFAKSREGDFKLSVVDKATGETVYSDLFWTRAGRYMAERGLRDKMPGMEIKTSEVDRGTKGNPYNVSTVPFEELMETVRRDDPRRKAIESIIGENKGKSGFGRHAIQRRNIAGGELTPENFYKAFETYVDSAYRYKSNIELKKMGSEFQFDTDINAPRMKNWINTYIDLASGGFKPGWMVDAVHTVANALTKAVTFNQLGSSAPTKILQNLNNYFMFKALFAWRPNFLLAQVTQPAAFGPQWLAHYQTQGHKGGVTRSIYEGEKLIVDSLAGKGDPEFRSFISDYMVPRGNIDPTMIHSMDLFGSGTTALREGGRWATGIAPAQAIEAFGRLQAAAMGYSFFKQSGLKGKELFAHAERFTNDMMVDYAKQEQPSWIGKTGMVGQAAGPLSTFASNYWGSTVLFLQDIAKNPGNMTAYKPMAIHLAQTAIWAGLTGLLGAKTIDIIIEGLKAIKALDPDWRTFTEYVMTEKDIPDMAAFGLASGATGLNLGASMAAPDMRLPSMNTLPGVKLLDDFITNLWPVISPFQHATNAQYQAALKTVLPNYIGTFMDVYDLDPRDPLNTIRRRETGEIVPNPMKRGFGTTSPDESDQLARMLGTRSLNEVRENEGVRAAKQNQELKNSQKTQLIDLAVDTITGKGDEDIGELMGKAVDLGMTPKDFMNQIKSVMKARGTEAETRMTGPVPKTPAQQQKYELIDKYKR